MSPGDLARESRRAQGLPPTVEDSEALAKIARILAGNGNAGPRKTGATTNAVITNTTAASTAEGGGRHGF